MKKYFSTFKRGISLLVAVAMLCALSACGGGSTARETVEYSVNNDRVGLQTTFSLPGTAEDWDYYSGGELQTSQSHYFDTTGEAFDESSSWDVSVSLSVSPFLYKDLLMDGKEPTQEGQSVIAAEDGTQWVKNANEEDHFYSYGTILDEFVDGYHIFQFTITPSGPMQERTDPDLKLLADIEQTMINTFQYSTDYEGKPDYSNGAYTGSHIVKWPFEIPFEGGTIKAEEFTDNLSLSVKFTYEDPATPDTPYEVILWVDELYNPEDHDNMSFLDYRYFGPEADHKDDPYEKVEIAGYPAAMIFGQEMKKDAFIVECVEEGATEYPTLSFYLDIKGPEEDVHTDAHKEKAMGLMTAIVDAAEFQELDLEED
ncbi:MAG: hypothetical protein Q4E76_05835 [Tissierellia bacterium]|nr:hypothetical protein [Tissierellia bacterium]